MTIKGKPIECEDCGGDGWMESYSLGSKYKPDGYHTEKCDTCNRFKSDQEAVDYVNLNSRLSMLRRRKKC